MGIQLVYQPDANMVGQAAYTAGLGQYTQRQQAIAEQQRQFDARQKLAEQGFAQEQQNDAFRQQLAEQQFGEGQYQFDSQLVDRSQSRYAQLADQQMRNQAGLQSEYMQQQGLTARQNNQIGSQMEMQRYAQLSRQQESDWKAIQDFARRGASPDEYQEAVDNFSNKYAQFGLPMPVEIPPPDGPDWQNPEKQLEMARERDPYGLYTIDENGQLTGVRGSNYQASPQWQQEEHARKLEQEDRKAQYAYDKAVEQERMKTEREMLKARTAAEDKIATAQSRQKLDILKQKIKARKDMLLAEKPNPADFMVQRDQPGLSGQPPKKIMVLDKEQLDAAKVKFQNKLDALDEYATRQFELFDAGQQADQQSPSTPQTAPQQTQELPPPAQSQPKSFDQEIQEWRSRVNGGTAAIYTQEHPFGLGEGDTVEDIKGKYGLQPGTWVKLRDGRVGQVK